VRAYALVCTGMVLTRAAVLAGAGVPSSLWQLVAVSRTAVANKRRRDFMKVA
jgi:hypothetical protein